MTHSKRYGRARTAQRPRWRPNVWWMDAPPSAEPIRLEGRLLSTDDNGIATVGFRNGRSRHVPKHLLHHIQEESA